MSGRHVGPTVVTAEPVGCGVPLPALCGRGQLPLATVAVRDRLFRDEEFAALYYLDNGRPSVLTSLLATALLLQAQDVSRWAEAEGYGRYLEPSLKGSTEVDWSDPEARRGFLAAIVADAERLLGQALTSPQAADREHPDRPRIMAAAELLCKLLLQDIERRPDGVAVREGVSQDRIVLVELRTTRISQPHRDRRTGLGQCSFIEETPLISLRIYHHASDLIAQIRVLRLT